MHIVVSQFRCMRCCALQTREAYEAPFQWEGELFDAVTRAREARKAGAEQVEAETRQKMEEEARKEEQERLDRAKNAREFTAFKPGVFDYSVWDTIPSDPAAGTCRVAEFLHVTAS
jgi:hypothetical protein